MPGHRSLCRHALVLVVAAIGCLAMGRDAAAQGLSRVETINGSDGWPIRFTYYPALEKLPGKSDKIDVRNSPVVILLHGAGGDRLFWDKRSAWPGGRPGSFAEELQAAGFAVLSIDQRKHGESVREGDNKLTAADYELMVADLVRIKQFIFEQHQLERLNMRKCGIVALDDSCPVALAFADYDWRQPPYDDHAIPAERTPRGQDIRALVLVSPTASVGQLRATNYLRYLANPEFQIAVEFVVGKKDSAGVKSARTLYRIIDSKANEGRIRFDEPDSNEKSEHLFGNPRLRTEAPVMEFLKKYVQEPNIPWVDRRSRRDR